MIPAASGFVGQTFGDGLRRQRADNIAVRSLKESINALPPKVLEVRKGFIEVHKVLGNLRSRNTDAPLRHDWNLIAESFDCALEKSRHIALKSAMAIDEFREVIIPYLMNEDDFESKKPELLEYKKTLNSGQSLASEFLGDLDDIAKELELFKDQVMELGNEDVTKQFKCLKDRFLVLKFRLAFLNTNKGGSQNRDLRDSSAQSATPDVIVVQQKVAKCQAAFEKGQKTLIDVWTLISEDIVYIGTHIERTANELSWKDFKRRVEQLKGLYVSLQGSLEKYANALSQQPAVEATAARLRF